MGKCGKGLGKEFSLVVLRSEVPGIFNTEELRKFIKKRGWNPSEKYVNVLLANSASLSHSKNYPQYFKSIGDGKYVLSDDIKVLL